MATLTPMESAIMDRWDAGLSTRHISRDLNLDADTVRRVVSTFHGFSEERRDRAMVVRGSARLLQAITQARAGAGAAL